MRTYPSYQDTSSKKPQYSEGVLKMTDTAMSELEQFTIQEQNQIIFLIRDKLINRRKELISKMNDELDIINKSIGEFTQENIPYGNISGNT